VRIKIELLKDEADFRPQLGEVDPQVIYVRTLDFNVAFLDGLQSVDAPDKSAFSRTAGAADYNYFAPFYVQVDILEDVMIPEPLMGMADSDQDGTF
jgi:hypothetical protein